MMEVLILKYGWKKEEKELYLPTEKPTELLEETYFDEIEDGLAVQIPHIGSYDTEPESLTR